MPPQPPAVFRPLSLLALIAASACGNADLQDATGTATAAVSDAEGRHIGFLPIESPRLDRIDVVPFSGGALAAVHHGRVGGSTVFRVNAASVRPILATERNISSLAVSPAGNGFAYVVASAPSWTGPTRRSALQYHGELRWSDNEGHGARMVPVDDASRVLGWLDDRFLVFTRFLPGDLPEERPYVFDLAESSTRPIGLPVPHVYSLALIGDQLVYSASSEPIFTLPRPDLEVSVMLTDPLASAHRVLSRERGALPSEFAPLGGGQITYSTAGARQRKVVDIATGHARSVAEHPAPPASKAVPYEGLIMPYVHQVYDTPDDFNGHWACGPTSTLMGILHFGRLDPWPETVSSPTPHESPYGAYVSRQYEAYGTTFDRMQTDASGHPAHGAYGWCTDGGMAWAYRMQDYAEAHGLETEFDDAASFAELEAATSAGKVVALSTNLTSAGHIIAVKGTTPDGHLIVNDPYGDRNAGYINYEGEDVVYTFAEVAAKWFITLGASGPRYAATLVASDAPATMEAGQSASVRVTYRNEGTSPWDEHTRLGTTEPRDRESVFRTMDWLDGNRPAGVSGTVFPGDEVELVFTIEAPNVCEPTGFNEHFNLVQEDVAWFSDEGGPADDELVLSIDVNPQPGACDAGSEDGPAVDSGASGASGAPGGGDAAVGADVQTPPAGGTYKSDPADGCACGTHPARSAPWPWLAATVLLLIRPRRARDCVA